MSDDYLWDGSGPVDPDVERLERLLAPLRSAPSAPRLVPSRAPSRRWRRIVLPPLAVAAALLLAVLLWQRLPAPADSPAERTSVAVDRVSADGWFADRSPASGGAPEEAAGARAPIAVGTTVTTADGSSVRLSAREVGEVVVEPGSRVRLVASGDGHERLALEHGALQAFIVAPPGRFVVETPSATAVDLGCVYTLRIGENGDGALSVAAGWVAFEFKGRESFVPAGASCPTRASSGPGLPRFDEARPAFARAIDDLESTVERGARLAALRAAVRYARPRDAMTLWHLIPRVTSDERPLVVRGLERMVPRPDGVNAESVMHLDRDALDRWWDALGLGEVRTWRDWKRPLPLGGR